MCGLGVKLYSKQYCHNVKIRQFILFYLYGVPISNLIFSNFDALLIKKVRRLIEISKKSLHSREIA